MNDNIKFVLSLIMLLVLAYFGTRSLNLNESMHSTYDNQSKFDARSLITAIEKYNDKNNEYFFNTESRDANWTEVDENFFPTTATDDYVLLTDSDISVLNKVIIERIINHDPHMRIYSEDLESSMFVCYLPKSLAYSQEATFRCKGNLPEGFPTQACADIDNPWYCIPF